MNNKERIATVAISVDADFEDNTWTFQPVTNFDIASGKQHGVSVGAGRYVLIREDHFREISAGPVFDSIKAHFPDSTGWPGILAGIENQRHRLDAYANGTASDCARAAIKGANAIQAKLETLLKAAKTYAMNNLQDERDEPDLCHDAKQRAEIVALFDAIADAEST